MTSRFRVASMLARKLEELGVSPADVLRQAGLPRRAVRPGEDPGQHRGAVRLYRGLAEASRDPAIGLKLGTEPRVERYDPIAIAAVSARSFRDALRAAGALQAAHLPGGAAAWWSERDECRVQFRWLLAQEAEPPLLVDLCFAWVVDIARRGIGGRVTPKRLELRGATAHRDDVRSAFRLPGRVRSPPEHDRVRTRPTSIGRS